MLLNLQGVELPDACFGLDGVWLLAHARGYRGWANGTRRFEPDIGAPVAAIVCNASFGSVFIFFSWM